LIGLFGGTFDPVHNGHLHAAGAVCDELGLDRLALVLSARPGHRAQPRTPLRHRWCMLEIACRADRRLQPDDREVRRAAPSYTVDTLVEVRAERPHEVLLWVLGSDQFRSLPTWHRWRELLQLTNLVVLKRPGEPLALSAEVAELLAARRVEGVPSQPAGSIRIVEAPMLDISATVIRQSLAAGAPVAHLLPPGVYTYIRRHGLYGVTSDP
jgi:nicotinate-nucleotide adenylyltransferase